MKIILIVLILLELILNQFKFSYKKLFILTQVNLVLIKFN